MSASRHTGITGGIYKNITSLIEVSHRVDTLVRLLSGERYSIDASNKGNGIVVSGGNFANPIITDNVKTHTLGSTLIAGRVNELQDGSSFPLPMAANYDADTFIDIEQPVLFAAFTPSVIVSGGDSINGDTDILFAGPTSIRLTTDGVSQWRL